MSKKPNPPMPACPFALLLVEGGDEQVVCREIAGATIWKNIHCWVADGGPDLPNLASLAALDPNFSFARGVGVVMDVEESLPNALSLAARTLSPFGGMGTPVHGQFTSIGGRRLGVFLTPNGTANGSVESLCRPAVKNQILATCVDTLLSCAGAPHANQARTDKGWLQAYLAMQVKPRRFHEAFSAPSAIDNAHSSFEALRIFLGQLLV